MKFFTTPLVLLFSFCTQFVSAQQEGIEQEYRTFKGSNGVELEAVLLNRDDENSTAQLLLKNGRRATVPFDTLSAEDLEYVKAWSKEKAIFLMSCRGLTIRQLLELRGYEPIKFELEGNAIMFEGKLNGRPARIQVDTGAGTTLMHAPFVEAAGCKMGPLEHKIWGVAGFQPAGIAQVPKLELGSSVFLDEEIMAADRDFNMPKGFTRKEDILLGAEYLIKLEAVISYKERVIFFRPDNSDKVEIEKGGEGDDDFNFRIFKLKNGKTLRGKMVGKTENGAELELQNGKTQNVAFFTMNDDDKEYAFGWSEQKAMFMQHCQSLTVEELLDLRAYQSFQYKREGNHIFVDGTLNDNEVVWMIDTGADNSLLHLDSAVKFGCEVGAMTKKVYGIGGSAPAAATEIKKITLGDAVLTNRTLLATDMKRNEENKEQAWVGLFGADYMRELEAVITYRESRIFLKQ
ncbi:MAG: aspartyl protease family protein [Akkermansiaceae bacterium]|jgi:predicted aspartyl protease